MAMLRVALRGVAAHRVRFVATGLAVLLSVAFMAGTRILGDTVRISLGEVWSDVYERVDVVVRSARTTGGEGEGRRDRLADDLVDQVAAVDGVAAAEGSIEADVRVLGPDGESLRDPRVGPSTFLLDWPAVGELNGWALSAGRSPTGPGEVVIDPTTADEGGFEIGDPLTLVVAGEPIVTDVVGVASFSGATTYGGVPAILAEERWLQEVVGEPGRVDRIDVLGAEGTSPEVLADRISAAELAGVDVLTGDALAQERQDAIGEVIELFVQLVSAFGAIALFVGAFIIVNTFTIIVTQRTRELALLRALGASRRQVLGSVLAEALAVAVVAAALGAVAAVGVARGLALLIARFGFELPDTPLAVGVGAFLVPVALAVAVTCAAALVPGWRASRTAPIEAFRQTGVEEVHRVALRLLVGALLTAVAVYLVQVAVGDPGETATALVLAAAVPAIVGFAAAGPVVAPPIVAALGAPLAALSGVTGRLAQRNALRNPGRTSSTAAALVIGVSLVVVITVASSSLATTVGRVVDQTVQGDLVVSGEGGGVSVDVAPALGQLPEVATAAGVRVGVVGIGDRQEFVLAVDPAAVPGIVDLEVTEGELVDLEPDEVAIARSQAERDGVRLGDELEVAFPYGGDATVTVGAIYDRALTRNGEYLFSHAGWDPFVPASSRVDARVLVRLTDGTDRTRAESIISAALERWPGTEVLDVGAYRDQQVSTVVSRISYLYALLGLALVVGLLGIANTLLLGVYERTRELGLLRAVGARRRQLGAAVLQEAIVIAALGALVGVVLGVALGSAMVETLPFDDRVTVDVPFVAIVAIATAAIAAGLAAGMLPAWRAGRLEMLAAVAEE
jgi:putative ABC transport system permease protein